MRRYQLYLNPQSISIIDAFEKETDISRSKVIRSIIDTVAENLSEVLIEKKRANVYGALDSLMGCIKIKGKTNLSERVDEIYLTD